MGPSLQTWEFDAWARSRGLSRADAEQLRAVFEERDRLLQALEDLIIDADIAFNRRLPWDMRDGKPASLESALALISEICP